LRLTPDIMPPFMVYYGGDALWALAIFLGFSLMFPKVRTRTRVIVSLAVSWSIEFSELYQSDWINALPSTPLGGLILGYTFLWSDLLCYTCGIAIGVVLESLIPSALRRMVHES